MNSVAASVRRIRAARGISLSELARQSGIAKGTLIQLESARGNPTLETLMTLATQLGVPLATLIAEDEGAVVHVTRSTEGPIIRGDGVQLRLLHRMTLGEVMYELFDMAVDEGMYTSPPHAVGVIEHLLVHSGLLRAGPSDAPVELQPGDFISFSADRPHLYEGLAPTQASLTVVYPVGVTAPWADIKAPAAVKADPAGPA